MKGYKAFDKDLKCRGFQFEVGKTFKTKSGIVLCKSGFHFCQKMSNVFNYYTLDSRVCEVEALGEILTEGDKTATSEIKIIRELSKDEIKSMMNSGYYNSGHYNSGHSNSGHSNSGNYNSGNYNSGYYNSGHSNSGNYNSGNYNSGHYNSGYHNSGYYNSGHYNSGHSNSGNYNSGNYNSGYYNSGYHNSGFFNSNAPTVRLFNKDSGLTFNDPLIQKLHSLPIKPILQWVTKDRMTEVELKNHPSANTTGGFLRNTGKIDWSGLTDKDKNLIRSLPNFDDTIFKQITGTSLAAPTTIQVSHDGKTYEIDLQKAKELGIVK